MKAIVFWGKHATVTGI